jgi:hypothetical protein
MAAPTYSGYLDFNPDFAYGGRRWGANDKDAFRKTLAKRGIKYDNWARNHRTAARVFDQGEQQLYGMLQPQLTAIDYERQKRAAFGQRQQHDLAGFTQAIMGMLGEISPAIRGAYGSGAATMRAGGTGYGSVLNAANQANADKGNSLLDVLGAPEGQRLQGGDAGNVLAGLAGWVPSEMMGAQGKAYGDAAEVLPKEASFAAQMQMRSLQAQAQEDDDDFSNQIMQVLQGIPSARAQIQDRVTAQKMADQKFRLDRLESERDWYLKQQALYLSQGKMKLAVQAEKRAQQAQDRYDWESQGRDSNGDPQPGFTVNPKTGTLIPPGYHVDKKGNTVKDSSSSSGFTASQRASMIETIQGKDEDIKAMIVKAVENGEWYTGSGPPAPGSREKLGRKIFEHFKHLAGTPTAKKLLRKMIARALSAAAKGGASGTTGADGSGSAWDAVP